MSNFGGPNSQFEKEINKALKPLSKKLVKIENEMHDVIIGSIKSGQTSTAYWNKVRKEIDKLYKEMNFVYANWSEKNIPYFYKKSLVTIQQRIESLKYLEVTASKGPLTIINSNYGKQIINSLYQSSVDSFVSASIAGRRNMYTLTRLTQQTLVNESVLNLFTGVGFEMGDLRKSARMIAGELWGKLFDAADNKRFVQAGKFKYTPDYYAELIARTKFHQAHSQATLTQAANYGTDLVQISTHNTTTEICQQYEGKIFSISGRDKRFPILDSAPPFHPNCLHLMMPTFESGMEAQGTLNAFSAFSLGKISKPPLPSGFIPISKRSA